MKKMISQAVSLTKPCNIFSALFAVLLVGNETITRVTMNGSVISSNRLKICYPINRHT